MNTKQPTHHPLTRRAFLQRTTVAASAAWAAPLVLPGRVLGADGQVAANKLRARPQRAPWQVQA